MEPYGQLPDAWAPILGELPEWRELHHFVARERREHTVYPPPADVFTAFQRTAPRDVRVVIVGQDPYHGPGQAHGLAFSVRPGVDVPPSLRNIYRELADDIGCEPPGHGCLLAWADHGVLLLNAVLTVRAGEAASHRGYGWEAITAAALQHLAGRQERIVFLLWGKDAQQHAPAMAADSPHVVLKAPHPSPLSAWRGFFGSKPFSQANAALTAVGRGEIVWPLPAPAKPGQPATGQPPLPGIASPGA